MTFGSDSASAASARTASLTSFPKHSQTQMFCGLPLEEACQNETAGRVTGWFLAIEALTLTQK